MADREEARRGRSPFELRPDDDYSGLTLSDHFLIQGNLDRSFFNGADITNGVFIDVSIRNTEFTEAAARECVFRGCDLTGSDLIHTVFEHVAFIDCDFAKGEWREATFRKCRFERCGFDHTTITLCEFSACAFDEESLRNSEHRAVYFNVYTRCAFPDLVLGHAFGARNFGVPLTSTTTDLVPSGEGVTLEQLCLLNNIGRLKAIVVADAADALHGDLITHGRRRVSALAFLGRIIRVLTAERRISATTLSYIEDSVTRLASSVSDRDVFVAAMSAVIEIRSALFAIVSESAARPHEDADLRSVTIYFSETYSRRQAEILREALEGGPAVGLEITDFRNGSTLIEMMSVTAVSISAVLASLNFVLRQATVTVERVAALKRAAGKLSKPAGRRPGRKALAPRAPEVQSVLRAGAPELAPVRAAVRRHGRILIEMDDQAAVTLLAQYADLRREQVDPPVLP